MNATNLENSLRNQIKSSPTLKKRVQNHSKRGQERPHNANRNPCGKSSNGVDMLGEEKRKWNKDNKDDELDRISAIDHTTKKYFINIHQGDT